MKQFIITFNGFSIREVGANASNSKNFAIQKNIEANTMEEAQIKFATALQIVIKKYKDYDILK